MDQVTLAAILAAKERLAFLQAEIRSGYKLPVVSFTTNIPGPVKNSTNIQKLLQAAVDRFRIAARDCGFTIVEERFIYPLTGPAAILAVNGAADKLKLACMAIEESGFSTRLFDIDVFDAAGRQIARSSLGYPERSCFLCNQPAVLCRRLGRHSSTELGDNVAWRLSAFAAAATNPWPAIVWNIGSWAIEAMLLEAACTPAPGLVDRDNAGAHQDMDFFSFLMSSSALAGSMFRCAAAGWGHQGTPAELLPVLRCIGQEGEQQMLQATGGVNTQKGLLFLLGILTAAATYTLQQTNIATADQILATAAAMASGLVARELAVLKAGQATGRLTAGEKLYVKYGVTGIRGEIEAGLPSIKAQGLPVLKAALGQGLSLNDALVHTLLSLMTVVQDTTILNRHGLEILDEVQNNARRVMDYGGMLTAAGRALIGALDTAFIKRNISPGGVADLLAATYFLYLVETNHEK
ncbi:citrate lyase holo-[acyl-carrier protein] synthase [Sporomusa termitida]|uniref:Probable 2-(5''-triphosphoribosyl)-3'-dephosphocoenzyme-A synthase n=1 Tax=Sporomusa termitida TaxID=2377 RepID=A0A517DRM8_9FIRM|nr:citrate lyase holo-[acyl-carrier protein] synthase [Sporomusa termitida]QDR80011.1 2-(5''-triphosphoribosyl)-3'-dephosphocoenzyme-A synthase [Sporomusa termitida]